MRWTKQKIERYRKEGRGKGIGETYKSWLTTSDMPNEYNEPMLMTPYSWKHQRIYYLLSELDIAYFYMLEWDDNVIDIRENFPLEQEILTKIVESYDINNRKQLPLFVTTSFLITTQSGDIVARSVLREKDLKDPKQLQKLKIQQDYWKTLGIEWGIVSDKDINWTLARNVEKLHHERYCFHYNLDYDLCRLLINKIKTEKQEHPNLMISSLFRELAYEWDNVTPGMLFTSLWFLIANKVITFNVYQENLTYHCKLKQLKIVHENFIAYEEQVENRFFTAHVLTPL